MGILSYYLAISLDGFLARENGDVDWLDPYFGPIESPFDYERYYETVDSVIMGRKTYEKIMTFGKYPYKGKPGIMITRDEGFPCPEKELDVVNTDIVGRVCNLVSESKQRCWLVGGGELASFLQSKNLLDEIVLSVMPVMIGSGIRWMGPFDNDSPWILSEHYISTNGIAQLIYRRES